MAHPDTYSAKIDFFVQSLVKLEARGLISEMGYNGPYYETGDPNHWVNRWRRKAYTALPFGEKFLKLLEGGS
jgi:hypothetical protein